MLANMETVVATRGDDVEGGPRGMRILPCHMQRTNRRPSVCAIGEKGSDDRRSSPEAGTCEAYRALTAMNSPLPTGTVQEVKAESPATRATQGAISARWDRALSTTNRPPGRRTRRMSGHHPGYSGRSESRKTRS